MVALVAQGYTGQQIASGLGIAERAANTRVSNILTTLGLSSRTQAAMWAAQHGHTTDA